MTAGMPRRAPWLLSVVVPCVAASCGGADATAPVTGGEPLLSRVEVRGAPGAGVSVSPAGVTLVPGATVQLQAVDAGGHVVSASWSSADAAVSTVDATGMVTAVSAGSAPVIASAGGSTASAQVTVASAVHPTGNEIAPGEDIQARVDASPAGTRFVLKAGVHRMQQVRPRDGMTFAGEPGAVVSGARLIVSWDRSGALWSAGGQTQEGAAAGECEDGGTACRLPEDLFVDDVPLKRVARLSAVRAGSWYFDYAADRVYLADNPAGHRVEVSALPWAFGGAARGVTLSGLVIEKYAAPAQQGAVQGTATDGWTVQDCEVRLNHGIGVRTGEGMRVLRNRVHHNGELGIGGGGAGVLVEGNEIAWNNYAGFDPAWEAGGTKFVRTRDLVVRGNRVHHNHGHGLWADIDNIATLYEANIVEDNDYSGIFHEISYAAVIRGNRAARNGFGGAQWVDGAGILVSSSRDVEVYGNTVTGNRNGITALQGDRGSGAYGAHELANLYVHDNVVELGAGRQGVVQNNGSSAVFTSMNVRFAHGTYRLGSVSAPFLWNDRAVGEGGWKGYGMDVDGTFTP
ncbi:MAG TPA: right-handed parallel beta-helix repeat-containing protein [Longimicrobium sp.]|nr:right-handed parallel beta-helix repeat-containing protein [Longimicrobium sp.]